MSAAGAGSETADPVRVRTFPAGAGGPAPALSLVVAIYNKPDVLRLVLASCARQSFTGFEVLAADDGSGPEVGEVGARWSAESGIPLVHLWHERRGWRKNRMLNHAVRAARSEYLVFIDGDCLLGRRFLHDHWRHREPRRVLLGRRAEMSARWSDALTPERVASGRFERLGARELLDGLRGDAVRLEEAIRIPSGALRRLRRADRILGSNFSVHKADLVAINGFDEAYGGPGYGEDSDVQYRLSLIGVTGKSLRNLAIQFHVHHPLTRGADASEQRFAEVVKAGRPRCARGLEPA